MRPISFCKTVSDCAEALREMNELDVQCGRHLILADRIHDLTRWIPVSAKEILQVANDEKQKDWNDLKYQDVYRDGFVEGAHWMQARIQRITPPEDKP